MKIDLSSEKHSVLVVSPEVYRMLDPLEKVALHQMEQEGRARIVVDAEEGK
jgi:hypothetical protein